ncbi:MAG: hypothetical protein Q7S92_01695 [Candidatus Diapherotrites archaeon]|nr:hypothetical protein [Candidatus Diapherotrites archaeon]
MKTGKQKINQIKKVSSKEMNLVEQAQSQGLWQSCLYQQPCLFGEHCN